MLISSSMGRAAPAVERGQDFPLQTWCWFLAASHRRALQSRLLCFGNSYPCSYLLVLKRQIKSRLSFTSQCLGDVSVNKNVLEKQERVVFVARRLTSQRYCCNGEELTKAYLLKVLHVNFRSVLFMSRDYVVLFILENPFFLKASIVLDAVEIKSTSYFIQDMFALNYNRLLCSQTSESHVLNKLHIM